MPKKTEVILAYTTLNTDCVDDILAIDTLSNPHPWKAQSLHDSYRNAFAVGVLCDGKLVAYLMYQTVCDEAEIIHVVCHRDYQGRGIARYLLNKWLQQLYLHGIHTVFLEVRESNTRAQQLYLLTGFVEVGRRKRYYSNGEDALVMRLDHTK